MWLRRAIFGWLIPAAFLLPLWLLVGWISFGSSGWALFWVFLSIPIVFVGQLVLTLLVRARGTVRAARAVSWTDVGGFGAWHCLIVALGFFNPDWWAGVFILTIAVGIALFWITLSQLWREAKGVAVLHTAGGMGYIPPTESPEHRSADPEVIVLTEKRGPERP